MKRGPGESRIPLFRAAPPRPPPQEEAAVRQAGLPRHPPGRAGLPPRSPDGDAAEAPAPAAARALKGAGRVATLFGALRKLAPQAAGRQEQPAEDAMPRGDDADPWRRPPAPQPARKDRAPPRPATHTATTKPRERPDETYTVASGRQAAAALALYRGEPQPQPEAEGHGHAHPPAPAYRKRPALLGLFGGAAPAAAVAAASPSSDSSSPVASGHKARKVGGGRWQPPFASTPRDGEGSAAATPEDEELVRAHTPVPAPRRPDRPRYLGTARALGYSFSLPAEPSPLTKQYEVQHATVDVKEVKQPLQGDCQPVRPATPVPAADDREDAEADDDEDNSVDVSSEPAEEPSSGAGGLLNRQGSLELDESLGILTPDQMEPFSVLGAAAAGDGENSVLRIKALCREVVYVDQLSFPEYDSIMDAEARAPASPPPASPCSAADADATEHTLSPEELPADTPVRDDDDASDATTLLTASSSAEPSSRSSVAVSVSVSSAPPPPAAAQQAPAAPAPAAAHCFITSVTSITSLDTGYQGDGESSRPASRGAELSSPPGPAPPASASAAARVLALAQPPPPPHDPMTDSDFFTESDADGHEEARLPPAPAAPAGPAAAAPAALDEPPSSSSSSAAPACGDRRAQVIDGTLYNESQRLQQRCPSFTASSEMESSGVFSDLEPRRPEDGDADADADDASGAHDATPGASTGSASDYSQEKEEQSPTGSNVTAGTTVILEESALEEENNLRNLCSPIISELAAQQQNQQQQQAQTQGQGEPTAPEPAKPAAGKAREVRKFKMPKRNVCSKIKAMIEAQPQPPPHEDQENQRPPHRPKKGGRWDAVMSKIAQGQAEQRVLKTHLKEVKSKVLAGLSPDGAARRKPATPPSPAVAALERAASTDSAHARPKSRRTRARASPASPAQQPQLSGRSSVRSSVSDVSGEHAAPSCKSVSSLRSAKKRADTTRANSPLSDGSLNSSASHQPARRQSQQAAARVRAHSAKGSGASGGRSSKHLAATARVLKDSSRNNKLVSQRSTEEKNGAPDMKTPVSRKPASRRSAPVSTPAKPQPLRDHNRVAGSGAPLKEPAGKLQPQLQLQAAPAVPTRAQLHQLRHNAAGFEAFAVLVQYLITDTDQKRCRYEDEISRLERRHSDREAALLADGVSKLQQAEAEHKHKLRESEQRAEELRQRLEAADAETARLQQQVEDLVSRDREAQLQTEQTRCRYEGEISRLERLHAEREAALLEDSVARLQHAEAEHKRQLRESEQRAEELRGRLEAANAEVAHLQQQVTGLVSGLRQDRDAQLQVTAGRCHDLEEEVRSLRTVLDLRHEELAEVRRQNAELAKDAGELPGALQKIATLQARVEDLQEQLQHKVDFERQLSQENRKLNESFHHVAVQKQRLSQHNEELQWKLKQSTEAVHVITQALTSTPLSQNNHKTGRKLIDSFSDYSQAFPEISKSYTKLSSRSPLMQRRCDLSNSPVMHHDLEHPSPPASPKVKAVVEKSDSVSWVLDMDESPEAKVSRLVRRAGSFRGSSGLSPPSAAQSQTLPRSRGASGPGSRRSTSTSSGRSRTRAWSVSSSDTFVSCWGSSGTCATSTPVTMQRSVSGTPSGAAHSYGEDSYTISHGKMPLKRCSGDPDECSVNGDEDDDMRQHHNANGSVAKRSNADSGPSSLDGQLLSLRTCGSSNSSSASPPVSNTSSSTSSCSDAEHNYRHLNGTIIYQQVETDTADMRVASIPHLSGSSDLSILAAACAAAKPLMGAPKDAAGEAMISEETLNNENDGDGGDTSSDGEDPQSWENVGLLPSDNEA